MRIKFLQLCERVLNVILNSFVPRLESLRERVSVCGDCGCNRYTGEPCIKFAAPVVEAPRRRRAVKV
jgi:hypothetical protein